jgi:hypothetical protein
MTALNVFHLDLAVCQVTGCIAGRVFASGYSEAPGRRAVDQDQFTGTRGLEYFSIVLRCRCCARPLPTSPE